MRKYRYLLLAIIVLFIVVLFASQNISVINKVRAEENNSDQPITKKIQIVVYDPIMTHHGNVRLTQYARDNFGGTWDGLDYDSLTNQIINNLKTDSGGYVNYVVTEEIVQDNFPLMQDGFRYDDNSWLACYQDSSRCHPGMSNYLRILAENQSCEKLNSGTIDEVWMWGAPGFGWYESTLAGPGAFQYNGDPVVGTRCPHLLPIMGFSYERGINEAMEDFGHRTEAVLTELYGGWSQDENRPNDTFLLYDKAKDYPSHARCGDVHEPPNAPVDSNGNPIGYVYDSTDYVPSACDDWYNYPNLATPPNYQQVNCTVWGCNEEGYLNWWFSHMPKVSGTTQTTVGADARNIWNNWWKYIADYENAVMSEPVGSLSFNGQVAYYNFEETGGTIAADSSGNNNNGTYNGPHIVTGKFGLARVFDGVADNVTVPDSPSLNLTSAGTVSFWVYKAPSTPGYQVYLSKGHDSQYQVLDLFNQPSFRFGGDVDETTVSGTSYIPADTWTHVAATYDGNVLTLYINGFKNNTRIWAQGAVANSAPLCIGCRDDGYFYRGVIDDVRIFNRALTSSEVRALYRYTP